MATFEERFERFYPTILKLANHFGRTTTIPVEEYESYLCEKFYTKYDSYDPARIQSNFKSYMTTVLRQEAIKLATRKERRFYDSIDYIDEGDEDEEGYVTPTELVADIDVEEQVFDVMFVEEQLAKVSGDSRAVLATFFNDPGASFREISRLTGVEDKRVKRILEAVAKEVAAQ